MLRRETIIALRARHTAFRMALDILYPQQPMFPREKTVSASELLAEWDAAEELKEACRHEQAARQCVKGLLCLLGVAIFVIVWIWLPHAPNQPSPPPPARPISPE